MLSFFVTDENVLVRIYLLWNFLKEIPEFLLGDGLVIFQLMTRIIQFHDAVTHLLSIFIQYTIQYSW